jgi:hydroxymethylbilane synthase
MAVGPLRIATRQSALALWQAEHVAGRLRALHPRIDVALVPMTTRGDQILDQPLASVGGKGLFLKELEIAIQEGSADFAVHSMKDMPSVLDPGFAIAAVLEREDSSDALVSNRHAALQDLPEGAIVGTSSLRRQAQLRARRPDLRIEDLRGNVNTRLARLDEGRYDAIILASAGLLRLGQGARIRQRLAAPDWLPAVAQGAIGIECREGDAAIHALVAPLVHAATASCVAAERALSRELEGNCQVPIAGLARLAGATLELDGLVGDATTGRLMRDSRIGAAVEPEAVGRALGRALLDAGAAELIRPSATGWSRTR